MRIFYAPSIIISFKKIFSQKILILYVVLGLQILVSHCAMVLVSACKK